jgi:hypothetical protein
MSTNPSPKEDYANTFTENETYKDLEKGKSLYTAIWRWHFYAGIVFAPIIILLSITRGIYLFKPQPW